MFYAPFQDVQSAIHAGHLGDLNPLPWVFMLGNCCGWISYGLLTRNFFIFFANAPGFLLALWFNLAASKLRFLEQLLLLRASNADVAAGASVILREEAQEGSTDVTAAMVPLVATSPVVIGNRISTNTSKSPKELEMPNRAITEEKPAISTAGLSNDMPEPATPTRMQPFESTIDYKPPRIDFWALCMTTFWLVIISTIGFGQNLSHDTKQMIVGIFVNLNLVFFYGAPLSTIYTVMTARNAASIHIPTMMTNTANGVFWTAYGLAVMDGFVFVPNGLGAILGFIQMTLCCIFPRIESVPTAALAASTTVSASAEAEAEAAAAKEILKIKTQDQCSKEQQQMISAEHTDEEIGVAKV